MPTSKFILLDESLRPAHSYLQMFKDDVNVFPPHGIIASCTAGTSLKQLKMADTYAKPLPMQFCPQKVVKGLSLLLDKILQ